MSALAQMQAARSRRPEPEILIAALDACPEGLAIVEGGRVLYANHAFEQSLGPQVQNQDVMEHIRAAGSQAACGTFAAAGREFTVVSVGHREIWKEKSPAQNSPGVEAVGRLLSGVAHDFNNLITGILLYCDLLLASLKDDHRLRHHVEEMRAAGQQGGLLIQQLLSIARRETGAPHPMSWNVTVLGMQNFLRRVIGEHIELVPDLAEDLGLVRIAPAEMRQVILNLVLNARDAMPDGGQITLTTRHVPDPLGPDVIEFTVADTGCGIGGEIHQHLFEPFFTTKEPGHGNGLGLSSVRHIVSERGGTVKVNSEAGKGAKIIIRLPAIRLEQVHKSESKR